MSHIEIRNSLNEALESAVSVPIAYENNQFEPSSAIAFIAPFYLPETSEGLGKTFASSDEERGTYQVSVFIQSNALNSSGLSVFDTLQLEIIDQVKAVFYTHAFVGNVYIESAEVGAGSVEDGWFKRDVSINWISYQSRG